jgi:hypothetical protein
MRTPCGVTARVQSTKRRSLTLLDASAIFAEHARSLFHEHDPAILGVDIAGIRQDVYPGCAELMAV